MAQQQKNNPDVPVPAPARRALSMLEAAGHEAYVVGGCTRDVLLGREPGDWDITTSATPEETLAVFQDFRTIEVGLQHGTVAVLVDGMQLEITTYRVDGEYADSRHPDSVSFTPNLTEDLARRDFTMNAIAYSPSRGMVDEFGGQEDIAGRLVRCVGDPTLRFSEDALRILRALRFASVLDFFIEPATSEAIHSLKNNIRFVAAERISAELQKLLCGKAVFRILQEYRDVFAVFLPELEPCFGFEQQNPYHCYDVYTHICASVEAVAPDPELRLTMLLHDLGKPETFFLDDKGVGHFYGHGKVSLQYAREIALRLRLPGKMSKDILTLVEYHDYPLEPDRKILRKRLHKFGKTTLRKLIQVQKADVVAQSPAFSDRLDKLDTIELMLEQLLKEKPAFKQTDLLVDGEDLIALGMKPGPAIGALLEELLQKVMAEELPNERVALLNYLAGRIL